MEVESSLVLTLNLRLTRAHEITDLLSQFAAHTRVRRKRPAKVRQQTCLLSTTQTLCGLCHDLAPGPRQK